MLTAVRTNSCIYLCFLKMFLNEMFLLTADILLEVGYVHVASKVCECRARTVTVSYLCGKQMGQQQYCLGNDLIS